MTTAFDLVQDLRARGIALRAEGTRLRYRPASALSPDDVEHLRAAKAEVLALLTSLDSATGQVSGPVLVARLLQMPLAVFAREGRPVEIRVPWWPTTLFLVPDVRNAEPLWREGIEQARVWTAAELLHLLDGPLWTPDALRVVMVARREFGGDVVEVRARG